jgi:hypothetical protein
MEVWQNPLGAFGRAEQVGEREFHAAEFSTISHFLHLSDLFSIWLVCEYHYTRAECLRLNKFEFLLLALTMKKPLPVSYYNGEDHETVFINEILLHERVNELNATKDQ